MLSKQISQTIINQTVVEISWFSLDGVELELKDRTSYRDLSPPEMKLFRNLKKDFTPRQNLWSERKNFVCHPKLYTWLEMDYEEIESESVADVVLAFIGWGVLLSLLLVGSSKFAKERHAVTIRTATAKSVYQWIVKPQTTVKLNKMFLPGRMSFIFNMVPYSGSWNYNINGVKHNTNLTCGIKLGSMVWWDTFYHERV
ncbi:hypothetical protein C5167_026265 [Papaver somniferum]|nr:hypothetical protein C5167_026265 [Papaver somniferum]